MSCVRQHRPLLGMTSRLLPVWPAGKKTAHSVLNRSHSHMRAQHLFRIHCTAPNLLCSECTTKSTFALSSVYQPKKPEWITCVRFNCDRCWSQYTANFSSSLPFWATESPPLQLGLIIFLKPWSRRSPLHSSWSILLPQPCTLRQLLILSSKPLIFGLTSVGVYIKSSQSRTLLSEVPSL